MAKQIKPLYVSEEYEKDWKEILDSFDNCGRRESGSRAWRGIVTVFKNNNNEGIDEQMLREGLEEEIKKYLKKYLFISQTIHFINIHFGTKKLPYRIYIEPASRGKSLGEKRWKVCFANPR